ncbi:hypothetical protein [Bradyrhizobium sp. HKCCYLRH3061]|uniref:hypothetical protein n=1 Tax=Bradyrhizobium sp. HKCCYLRH3061 TaxID=3420734 RepID=UPI003EBA5688
MKTILAVGSLIEELNQSLIECGDKHYVLVTKNTLRTIFERFLRGDLSAEEIVEWASRIELIDEIQFDKNDQKMIADAVFEMASPEINGPLDGDMAQRWLDRLVLGD